MRRTRSRRRKCAAVPVRRTRTTGTMPSFRHPRQHQRTNSTIWRETMPIDNFPVSPRSPIGRSIRRTTIGRAGPAKWPQPKSHRPAGGFWRISKPAFRPVSRLCSLAMWPESRSAPENRFAYTGRWKSCGPEMRRRRKPAIGCRSILCSTPRCVRPRIRVLHLGRVQAALLPGSSGG